MMGVGSRVCVWGGVIFLGLKFWPKVIFFGSMKDAGIFFGRKKKKQRDFLGVAKKGLAKGFFGYVNKLVIFLGRQILKL